MKTSYKILSLVGCFFILAFVPFKASGYIVSFLSSILMFIALTQAWNVFSGFSGYVSFGHQALFGIGAYTLGISVINWGIPLYLSIFVAGLTTLLIAFVFGIILLRIRGPYFTILTLCSAMVVQIFLTNWDYVGGAFGMYFPAVYVLPQFYWGMLVLAFVAVLLAYRIRRCQFGLNLLAIKNDEDAANNMGVNATRAKVTAFLISALFFGLIGGLWAWNQTYINPRIAIDINMQIMVIAMVLFGGAGTILGPLIGTVVFMILQEILWMHYPGIFLVILGIVIVSFVRFKPEGILQLLSKWSGHKFV